VGGSDRVSIAIVVAVRLYREGLRDSLRKSEFDVVAVGSSAADALRAASEADVILLDVGLPGAIEVLRGLDAAAGNARPRVLALAIAEEDEEAIERWADAGAAGFVTCEDSLDDLASAIECAARGEVRCSPRLAATLLRHVRALAVTRSAAASASSELTFREREVLGLIDRGLTNKQIASRLSIEVSTVKNHVHNILEKLHVERRGQAAARARHAGVPHLLN
jgi:two-component system nitrate/nitrite response regulator NarL